MPRLRALDLRSVVHGQRRAVLLVDPLGLSGKQVVVPSELLPMLQLCDGTRSPGALRAALAVRYGQAFSATVIEQALAALDEALLLDNARYHAALTHRVAQYRSAPSRPMVIAGESYPADPEQLAPILDGFLARVERPPATTDAIRGLISPHIDYGRGAPVYAAVWKQVAEQLADIDLVFMLGTDHYGAEGTLTLTPQHYATPYGVIPTDAAAVSALASAIGDREAYADELHHCSEHSIELAAVWLHHLTRAKVPAMVPVMCGSLRGHLDDPAGPDAVAGLSAFVEAAREIASSRRTLVVAAADMAHVGPAFGGPAHAAAEKLVLQAEDADLLAACSSGDAGAFWERISAQHDENNVCGLTPIYLALRILAPSTGEQVAYLQCPADTQGASWVSVAGTVWR